MRRAVSELTLLFGPLSKYLCARGSRPIDGTNPTDGGEAARVVRDNRDQDELARAGRLSTRLNHMVAAHPGKGEAMRITLESYFSRMTASLTHKERVQAMVEDVNKKGLRLDPDQDRTYERFLEHSIAAYAAQRDG